MAVSKELLEKLDQWHEENKHREIVREIGELPEELRQDYDIQGRLAAVRDACLAGVAAGACAEQHR